MLVRSNLNVFDYLPERRIMDIAEAVKGRFSKPTRFMVDSGEAFIDATPTSMDNFFIHVENCIVYDANGKPTNEKRTKISVDVLLAVIDIPT